jgi:hypothetical protein
MPWDMTAIRNTPAARLLSGLLLASVLPSAAAAQPPDLTPECTAELATLDHNVVLALSRILATGSGTVSAQCAALANQIDAITREREAHIRCYPPGDQLDGVVAMLDQSATPFHQAQTALGCRVPGAA